MSYGAHHQGHWAMPLSMLANENWEYMSRSDHGLWNAGGALAYHADRRRIKLAAVLGTGHVDFRPILERLYAEMKEPTQEEERADSSKL